MKRTNRHSATSKAALAALWLLGPAACDLKGDPAAYLRQGQASKEPVSSASRPAVSSVSVAPATGLGASAAPPSAVLSASSNGKPLSYAAAPPGAVQPRSTSVPPPAEPPAPQTTHSAAAAPAAPPAHPVAAASSSPSISLPVGGNRNVSIGSASVFGGNVTNAARVVARLRAPLRACYSAAISSGPGSLRFTLSISKTGAVSSANAQRSGELSSDLVACAVGVVKSAKFDPPEHGAATLQVPATFVVQ